MTEIHDATWSVSLYCDCPKCDEYVNLLDYPDFWDGRKLEVCEERETLDVVCPKCDHEFDVRTIH